MNRIPIESSNIASVGYDADTRTLEVEFRGSKNKPSRIYQYYDIPFYIYNDLLNGGFTSAGRYFREAVVKGGYKYQEIKEDNEIPPIIA